MFIFFDKSLFSINEQINQTNLNIEELFEKYINDCQNLISEYEKKWKIIFLILL